MNRKLNQFLEHLHCHQKHQLSSIHQLLTKIINVYCLPNFSQNEHDKSLFLTPLNNTTPEFAYEDSVSESDTTNNAVFSRIESILN